MKKTLWDNYKAPEKVLTKKLKTLLRKARGLKIVETLKVTFEKTTSKDETITKTAYFNSNTFTITNKNTINEELPLSKQQIMNKRAQWVSEGSGWTVESVDFFFFAMTFLFPFPCMAIFTSHCAFTLQSITQSQYIA